MPNVFQADWDSELQSGDMILRAAPAGRRRLLISTMVSPEVAPWAGELDEPPRPLG
jgi:hypothetical protein